MFFQHLEELFADHPDTPATVLKQSVINKKNKPELITRLEPLVDLYRMHLNSLRSVHAGRHGLVSDEDALVQIPATSFEETLLLGIQPLSDFMHPDDILVAQTLEPKHRNK